MERGVAASMGPPLISGGKEEGKDGWLSTFLGFNGASADQRRKGHCCLLGLGWAVGFNGASADQRRKGFMGKSNQLP